MKKKYLKQSFVVSVLSILVLLGIIFICDMMYIHKFGKTTYEEKLGAYKNKDDSTEMSISFDEAYSMLDYTIDNLSNVERCHIMDSKSSILNARSAAMIEYLSNKNNDNFLWRDEANQWGHLADDIQAFITAKMEEQWETGKTGTAGSSYCSGCQFKLAIARAVFLETIIANPQERTLCDDYNLLQISSLSENSSEDVSLEIILNRIHDYLNAYISNPFYEWSDKDSFYDWHRETESTIQNLLTQLSEYLKSSNQTIESMNDTQSFDYLQSWLLEQVEQTIKIGD